MLKDELRAKQCAELLKAVADPDRLRLIQALRERPQSVSDLSALLDKDIGNVSHHLKVLRKQELVSTRREGKMIIYSLAASVMAPKGEKQTGIELGCCRLELPK
ncbi:MAG: metalloregulator ArsR/SmtB family transcription factor [Pirellulales bacterium]